MFEFVENRDWFVSRDMSDWGTNPDGAVGHLASRAIEILHQDARAGAWGRGAGHAAGFAVSEFDKKAITADIHAGHFRLAMSRLRTATARCRFYDDAVILIPERERPACVQAVFEGCNPLPSLGRSLKMLATVSDAMKSVDQSLPAQVTVYRAVSASTFTSARYWMRHVAWTFDRDRAEYLAESKSRRFFAEGKIAREHILACFESSEGGVVIINPHALTDLEIVELVRAEAA